MANYYDNYVSNVLANGNTSPNQFVNNTQRHYDLLFKESPNYVPNATLNGVQTDVRVLSTKALKGSNKPDGEFKHIIFRDLSLKMNYGDYLHFWDDDWLVMDKKVSSPASNTADVIRCNNKLKFRNKTGNIVSYPCSSEGLGRIYLDVINSKEITLPKDTFLVLVQLNADTQQIIEGQRFIINKTPFKVVAKTDILVKGILELKIQSDLLYSDDDIINDIPSNPYAPITITFPQSTYTINSNSTLQLTPTIKQGDEILLLSEYPVSWSVDNQGVASVNGNGLVTGINTGACKITCALKDNPNVFTTINIDVSSNVVTPSYNYVIEGSDTLKKTSTITLVAKVYDNSGIEVTNKVFDFRIANYNGVNPSDVLMTVIDDRTIKIKNINASSGSLYIIAQDRNSIYYADKDIQLTGIYG